MDFSNFQFFPSPGNQGWCQNESLGNNPPNAVFYSVSRAKLLYTVIDQLRVSPRGLV